MIVDKEIRLLKLETVTSRAVSYRTMVAWVDGLLIDSGFAHARRQLLAALEEHPVEQIANSHAHEDHCGNNDEVARRFGATIHAPAKALRSLAEPSCEHRYQRVVWGVPSPSRGVPLENEIRTKRFTFQVIPTPGHAEEHVCFFEPERGWLFGGDLFLGSRVPFARAFENGSDLIASLEVVANLKAKVFICYHRGVIDDPQRALAKKLAFMRDLQCAIEREHANGLTADEIARKLLGRESLKYRLLTGGDFSKTKLVRSLLKQRGEGYGAGSL